MKLACLVGWTKGPAVLLHLGEGRGYRSAWGRRRSRVKEEGRRDSRAPELEQRRRRERSAAGKGRTPVASGERTDGERGSRGKSARLPGTRGLGRVWGNRAFSCFGDSLVSGDR